MKKFILHSFLFFIFAPFLLSVLDIAISPMLLQRDRLLIWHEIYHQNINCEIAFFGSSRCQQFFDCNITEQDLERACYNFGISNAKIDITCLCLEYYLQQNIKPKYITLEVGYLTLLNDTIFNCHYQLSPLMYMNPSIYDYIKKYQGFDIKQVWIPLYRYSGYFGTIVKGALANYHTSNGFVPVNGHWKDMILGARINNDTLLTIDSSRIKFLDRFVDLCAKYNIKLNFVYVPEHTNYKDFYNNKQEIVEYYQEYAKNKGIPFKDFSADTIFNSDTSYFYNIEHVNKYGAAKFTRDYFVPYFKQLYNL